MNQGKLEVVKKEMTSININILRINELKWTVMVNIFIISTMVGKFH